MQPTRAARIVTAALALAAAAGRAGAQEPEEVRAFDLVDNGDFSEPPARSAEARATGRVPWWNTWEAGDAANGPRGAAGLEVRDGAPCLRTAPGESARQPIAAYAPLAGGITIRGQVAGPGTVVLEDGRGRRASFEVGGEGEAFEPFTIQPEELAAAFDGRPRPRLVLALEPRGGGVARWRDLSVLVPLPLPSRAALRAEIVAELDWIFRTWEERGGDRAGRATSFVASLWDVVTGAPTTPLPGGHTTLSDLVLAAAAAAPEVPGWVERRDRALRDLLTLAFHPETGLPRRWDCARDVPDDQSFVEVGAHLEFLLDVAEHGPEAFRAEALAVAERAGRTILARALLPDGEVCAKLRPADGAPNMGYHELRRLDVPAQLARLFAATGDAAFRRAALEGLAALEYTHAWPGTWREIDPGFDDNFGHYGARAVVMWSTAPADPHAAPFRRLALSGWEYYAPRWDDALRFGGQIAADQVRCWAIAARIAELDPERAARIAPLLRAAVRLHAKGGQYGDGTWRDVSVFGFEPKGQLQIGDTLGVPQNLLHGLALLHDERLAALPGGPDLLELRALFTAVLRTTRAAYRAPYGYLPARVAHPGVNESSASVGLAVGLVKMLERL